VDAAAVEAGLVRAVDADCASDPRIGVAAARDGAGLHGEPVAVEVLEVRVVEQEKVAPAGMGTLVDDHVQARRRAQVTLVELAARSAEAEYRREAFDAVPEA